MMNSGSMNSVSKIVAKPSSFFSHIKNNRDKILSLYGDPLSFCRELIRKPAQTPLPDSAKALLCSVDTDDRHYLISSTYALLIGADRRRELSAYFTPPVLAKAAIEAGDPFLKDKERPSVLDPACGGGSFLAPVARHLVRQKLENGTAESEACRMTERDIQGIEIDAGLSELSRILLGELLAAEFSHTGAQRAGIILCEDTLLEPPTAKYDLVIGNPPYGKVGAGVNGAYLADAGLADLGGHTNLYSLFLLRSLDWLRPGGGLVFVLPTSFVAGPYFSGLRQELLARAEILRIDLHEQREYLFLGAVQDVCLLTVKRRNSHQTAGDLAHSYELGIIDSSGKRSACGKAIARAYGEAWTLPVAQRNSPAAAARAAPRPKAPNNPCVIADYGYRVRVGKVVPTRERDRLHDIRKRGDFPLVWASAIRPDGSFDFAASKRLGNAAWYKPVSEDNVSYATVKPAVIVQRTSNRDQKRRLNAAAVPRSFYAEHDKGFVAENHVIVIEATDKKPALTPKKLAKLLNAEIVNERFSAVSGSFSVSAKLLGRLALPHPDQVKALDNRAFETSLRALFVSFDDILVLASSDSSGNTKNSVDESGDLRCRPPVDKNTGLKRSTLA